jgi:imidazole glycerol-phosphate synthase subunit HisF
VSLNNLCKRIIPCLDVANGRTVKGVNFTNLRDMGDPVELAQRYEDEGADELMFLDISASQEARKTVFQLVEKVAHRLSIPFTVGGGIGELKDVKTLLNCGADKVSVNTSAVKRPELVTEIAVACGSQCCVLAIDARKRASAGTEPVWDVLINGGRVNTGLDAFDWGRTCVENGAGEILLTSWDRDGTEQGFDLEMVRCFADGLSVPVIASGGAQGPESFIEVFKEGHADAALAATIFHDGRWTVERLKEQVKQANIPVRTC